jgi:hypothetical protein
MRFIILLVLLPLVLGCLTSSDCSHHGQCIEGACECDPPYAKEDCSYRRKDQKDALIWSVSLGFFGADRLYLDYSRLWVGKLILGFVGVVIGAILLIVGCCGVLIKTKGCLRDVIMCSGVLIVLTLVACLVWYIVDIVLIATNRLHDGHGYKMNSNL